MINVLSWNVSHQAMDGERRYYSFSIPCSAKRQPTTCLNNVANYLLTVAHNFDIICIIEATDKLKTKLSFIDKDVLEFRDPSRAPEMMLVYYNSSYRVKRKTIVVYARRIICIIEFDNNVIFIGAHLPHPKIVENEHINYLFDILRDNLSDIPDLSNYIIIIVGDFNTESDPDNLQINGVIMNANILGPKTCYTVVKIPRVSGAAQLMPMQFAYDRIFASLSVHNFQVHDLPDSKVFSDHLPISAAISARRKIPLAISMDPFLGMYGGAIHRLFNFWKQL